MRSKTLLTALAVILILAAGAYFVGMPMINQHYAKKLQNELNKLPGCSVASIDSKGFGQNFIIKDLRLRFDTLDEYTFMESHIEKAEINGLNISAFSATTTNLLFDEIVITGATNLIKSTKYETIGTPATEDEATTIMAMNSSSMTIRGMKLNVPAFNAYINSGEFEKAIYNSGFYIDYMSGHNMLFEVFSTYSGESEFSLSFASHIAKTIVP